MSSTPTYWKKLPIPPNKFNSSTSKYYIDDIFNNIKINFIQSKMLLKYSVLLKYEKDRRNRSCSGKAFGKAKDLLAYSLIKTMIPLVKLFLLAIECKIA